MDHWLISYCIFLWIIFKAYNFVCDYLSKTKKQSFVCLGISKNKGNCKNPLDIKKNYNTISILGKTCRSPWHTYIMHTHRHGYIFIHINTSCIKNTILTIHPYTYIHILHVTNIHHINIQIKLYIYIYIHIYKGIHIFTNPKINAS